MNINKWIDILHMMTTTTIVRMSKYIQSNKKVVPPSLIKYMCTDLDQFNEGEYYMEYLRKLLAQSAVYNKENVIRLFGAVYPGDIESKVQRLQGIDLYAVGYIHMIPLHKQTAIKYLRSKGDLTEDVEMAYRALRYCISYEIKLTKQRMKSPQHVHSIHNPR
jgi:hypothetical protein